MAYRRLAIAFTLLATISVLLQSGGASAGEPRKVRMGYFEGGKYQYHDRLRDEYLKQLNAILPDSIEAVFAPEGYRSAEWEKKNSERMARELAGVQTIDLVVAMGPWVVHDLLNAGYKKPIVAMHQFAPQFEGLLDKKRKPVASNLTIHYQKNKIESDLTSLASLVKVRRLGLLYFPSTIEADSVLAQAKAAGAKLGFEVVTATGESNKGTFAFFNAYGKLDKKIDALYIGPMWACDIKMINQFFYNVDHDRIPVMTSEDRFLVDRGAFLSNNSFGIYSEARFNAYKTAQVILGNKPAKLAVEFSVTPSVAINEAAAKKNQISIERKLYSEAYVVPAPPDEDVTMVTLSYAIGRAVSFNPGDTAKREAIESALKQATRAYEEYFPNSVDRANLHEEVMSVGTIKSIHLAQMPDTPEPNNPESTQLKLEHAVTNAFLNYIRAEEVLMNEYRIRELIDRNTQVSYASQMAENTDDHDLIQWRAERVKSTQSIIDAQNNLIVARILLNVLMNYAPEQELSLDGERFQVETTQKFYGYLTQSMFNHCTKEDVAAKIAEVSGESELMVQKIFERQLSGFENFAKISREIAQNRQTLGEKVSAYDGAEVGIVDLINEINQFENSQLTEISERYGLYESMSELVSLLGWSAYDTGISFTSRFQKLIVEGL